MSRKVHASYAPNEHRDEQARGGYGLGGGGDRAPEVATWRCVKVKPGRMDARLRQATSRSRKANEWPRIIPGLCSSLNAPKDLDAQHPRLYRHALALTTFSSRPFAPALNL